MAGLALLARVPVSGHLVTNIILPMVAVGLGAGAVMVPASIAAMAGAAAAQHGVASALLNVPSRERRPWPVVTAVALPCRCGACPRKSRRQAGPTTRQGGTHRDAEETARQPGIPGTVSSGLSVLVVEGARVARELAGRASPRLLPTPGTGVSRHTALRVLPGIPLPARAVPLVLGTGDFALRHSLVYATVLSGAETGR